MSMCRLSFLFSSLSSSNVNTRSSATAVSVVDMGEAERNFDFLSEFDLAEAARNGQTRSSHATRERSRSSALPDLPALSASPCLKPRRCSTRAREKPSSIQSRQAIRTVLRTQYLALGTQYLPQRDELANLHLLLAARQVDSDVSASASASLQLSRDAETGTRGALRKVPGSGALPVARLYDHTVGGALSRDPRIPIRPSSPR